MTSNTKQTFTQKMSKDDREMLRFIYGHSSRVMDCLRGLEKTEKKLEEAEKYIEKLLKEKETK